VISFFILECEYFVNIAGKCNFFFVVRRTDQRGQLLWYYRSVISTMWWAETETLQFEGAKARNVSILYLREQAGHGGACL
jgi:hypothetical protein